MKWIDVKQLPETSGTKFVFVPTGDENSPYYGTAWFEVEGTENMAGWQLLPESFCNGITHWMEPEHPATNNTRG